MRRKRSTTINTESYEDFMQECKEQDTQNQQPQFQTPKPHYNSVTKTTKPTRARFGSVRVYDSLNTIAEEEDNDDFCFVTESNSSISSSDFKRSPTTISAIETDDGSCSATSALDEEPVNQLQKMMVIGAKGTGRHSLLDMIFDGASSNLKNNHIQNMNDLVLKSRIHDNKEIKYKFWIQDPTEKSIETLYNVYYKSISTYVLVFKLNDRDTMTDLISPIKNAKKMAGQRMLNFILIGTCSDDEEKREISNKEAKNFAKDFGLNYYLETNSKDEQIKTKFLELID